MLAGGGGLLDEVAVRRVWGRDQDTVDLCVLEERIDALGASAAVCLGERGSFVGRTRKTADHLRAAALASRVGKDATPPAESYQSEVDSIHESIPPLREMRNLR